MKHILYWVLFKYPVCTFKPVLRGHSKRTPKIGFQYHLSLNAGQKYCRMLSILQYFRPSLSYHFPLRPFLSTFKWVLKTGILITNSVNPEQTCPSGAV